jgi:hypothetical protein
MKENKDHLEMEIVKTRVDLKKDLFDLRHEFQYEMESVEKQIILLRADSFNEFKEIRSDTSEIKERISFLEALSFASGLSENPRSESAKRMWQRRRTKKIGFKEDEEE